MEPALQDLAQDPGKIVIDELQALHRAAQGGIDGMGRGHLGPAGEAHEVGFGTGMAAIPAQEREGLVAQAVLAGLLLSRTCALLRGSCADTRRGLNRSCSPCDEPGRNRSQCLRGNGLGALPDRQGLARHATRELERAQPAAPLRRWERHAHEDPLGRLGLRVRRSTECSAQHRLRRAYVRPRSAAAKASSVSADAWATAWRATDHEISPEGVAARSRGSPASASQTRAHSRRAWAVTASRSRA